MEDTCMCYDVTHYVTKTPVVVAGSEAAHGGPV